jgi:orotidine-5'-phosphate decarboxylase
MSERVDDFLLPPMHHLVAAQDHDEWGEAELGLLEYGDMIDLAKLNSLSLRVGFDEAIRRQEANSQRTMIDLKFNDIKDTMRRNTREATLAGASVITLHASASEAGLKEAVKGVEEALGLYPHRRRPWLVGVTVLTSFEETVAESIFGAGRLKKVKQFTHMSADAGLDGVVCSVSEAEQTRQDPYTEHLVQFIPAVRPSYAVNNEQAMASTPAMAAKVGADFMIVGRPLIRARDYGLRDGRQAAEIIHHEYQEAA